MAVKPDADVSTRDNILRLIIERGPITSAELASMLVLTSAAVRRHLTQLETDGQIAEYTGAASRPARRGRPSRRYVATSLGQATFGDSYADVANQVLSFLKDSLGDEGVNAFASQRIDELEARYTGIVDEAGPDPEARAAALANALTRDGYAASVRRGPGNMTLQLCQGHCPIHDVASSFPVMCEAETQAFHRLLNVHVQRLATLAGGEHVCTLTIPLVSRIREAEVRKETHDTNPA